MLVLRLKNMERKKWRIKKRRENRSVDIEKKWLGIGEQKCDSQLQWPFWHLHIDIRIFQQKKRRNYQPIRHANLHGRLIVHNIWVDQTSDEVDEFRDIVEEKENSRTVHLMREKI